MTIKLTAQHESLIEHAIHSGQYRDATDVISAALEALAEDLDNAEVTARKTPANSRRVEAIERLRTFGKTHGLSLGGITLRQLRDESRP